MEQDNISTNFNQLKKGELQNAPSLIISTELLYQPVRFQDSVIIFMKYCSKQESLHCKCPDNKARNTVFMGPCIVNQCQ